VFGDELRRNSEALAGLDQAQFRRRRFVEDLDLGREMVADDRRRAQRHLADAWVRRGASFFAWIVVSATHQRM